MIDKSEAIFEKEFISYLTQIGGGKQWEYMEHIKTTEDLWSNFKRILEQNNSARLDGPLSITEFNQVKKIISNIETPYQAGQFLYGVNGVSEIEIDLDNGKHVFLTVFDQSQVGGGNTVYQVVNQIKRKKIIDGKADCRFDVTLLINGLPIIQIELKKDLHGVKESFNQMHRYIAERQYSDIFSTLQILIGMTPYDIKYMANTTKEAFNYDFAFRWQDEKESKPVMFWKTFTDKVLSIPMAHELATRYMILDGTKNKESIKVMRPYQVYATKNVLDKIRAYNFKSNDGRLGYIWHTTGSGKTITSFKTAWLASRLPNVGKVVFLVDRVALTNQTADAYRAYEPTAGIQGQSGIVTDTANISDLHRKLTGKKTGDIIVTSIQKMSRYVSRKNFKDLNKNILFIVDEAHRSAGDGKDEQAMLEKIRNAVPTSAWVGYTGTPKFPTTRIIFGDLLHSYTIKEAIADRNVLGFKVEFKETIEPPENPTEEDIDDNIRSSVYDTSTDHVELVVKDIFDNWRERSNNRKYNALFTVHVGGRKPSTPRAMEYFDAFLEENKRRKADERLKVAVSFSMDSSNSNNQLTTNENLLRAMKEYEKTFGVSYDMKTVRAYHEDIARRLNKTSDDGNYLDLVIVVNQFLTGFDAPELNTLYVDRTLKDGNLIQAYSRTNRVHNFTDKPHGNIVNYRWPKENEYQMNMALAVYSNRDSACEQMSLEDLRASNEESGLISKPFNIIQAEIKNVVNDLDSLTDGYSQIPPSEHAQEVLYDKLREYNNLLSQMKQHTEDEDKNPISAYDNPDEFYKYIGITREEEIILTTVIAGELKERRAKQENIDISQVNLSMIHIHDVIIDYDFLVDLIADMADQVHANEMDKAADTRKEIDIELAKSENENEKMRYRNFVDKIYSKEFTFDNYPAPRNREKMNQAMDKAQTQTNIRLITNFIRKWGLDNIIKPIELEELIKKHRHGQKDLDNQGEVTDIMNAAKDDYVELADEDVASLTWVRYRIDFRDDLYDLADDIKKGEM